MRKQLDDEESGTADYDAEFDEALKRWQSRYKVKSDDTVMLLLELFRIHQGHWDAVRQRDTMGYSEFREMIRKQHDNLTTFERHVQDVTAELRNREVSSKLQAVGNGIFTATVILLLIGAGILIGKFVL